MRKPAPRALCGSLHHAHYAEACTTFTRQGPLTSHVVFRRGDGYSFTPFNFEKKETDAA